MIERHYTTVLCLGLAFAVLVGKVDASGFLKHFGSPGGYQNIFGSVATASGNTFITGAFNTAQMQFGTIAINRVGNDDAYVAKLDSDGNTLWARSFTVPSGYAGGTSLTRDGFGHAYVLATSFGDLSVPVLERIGQQDLFVVKLNENDGTIVWAKNFGGSGAQVIPLAIIADTAGNLFVSGSYFQGQLTTPPLPASGATFDALLMKLDGLNGQVLWARAVGTLSAYALATDGVGSLYVGATAFNGAFLPVATALKLNGSDGSTVWTMSSTGPAGLGGGASSIAVDEVGNPYLGGTFIYEQLSPPVNRGSDAFLLKLNKTDGNVEWTRLLGGGPARLSTDSLAVRNGIAYLSGHLFEGDSVVPPIQRIGIGDAFVLQLKLSDGSFQSVKNFGGVGANVVGYLRVDGSGRMHFAGNFSEAGLSRPNLPLLGQADAFLLRFAKITYEGNGSSGGLVPVDEQQYIGGELVTVLGETTNLTRSGYQFAGWNTAADGSGNSLLPGATFAVGSSDVILYAQWTSATGVAIPSQSLQMLLVLVFVLAVLARMELRKGR